ncbi:MAG: HAD family hydrolase [Ruminococcaceae bacterium]|nr:HAD family hydrolase [Oscillospiraceae bacterium]
MLKAIIFDFDGTIADTLPALCEGVNLTMAKYGYPLHDEAAILRFINNGARKLIQRAMPEHLQADEELVTRVLADYDAFYGQVYHHTDRAYDGLIDVIRALHDDLGLQIAVLSNKQDAFVKRLCAQILPNGYCQAAVGVTQGMPTKPDARLTQSVLDTLGVAASECVMVGDSDIDLRTAQNAGLHHVCVTWGFRDEAFLREKGAEQLAHTPQELFAILEKMTR